MPRFIDYHEAHAHAAKRATDTGLPVAIRACKEYGKPGFNVSFASRNDSDYARAEIVRPGDPIALAPAPETSAGAIRGPVGTATHRQNGESMNTTQQHEPRWCTKAAGLIDPIFTTRDDRRARSNAIVSLAELWEACEYVDSAAPPCDPDIPDEALVTVTLTMRGLRQLRDAVSIARRSNA